MTEGAGRRHPVPLGNTLSRCELVFCCEVSAVAGCRCRKLGMQTPGQFKVQNPLPRQRRDDHSTKWKRLTPASPERAASLRRVSRFQPETLAGYVPNKGGMPVAYWQTGRVW